MQHNNDTLIATTFHTADAADRCAAADAQFAVTFAALPAEEQARTWRGLDHGSKFRLIVRRIEALGMSWMPSTVAEYIAKYDERFALGPVEMAVEGALERLALDNSGHAVTAIGKDDRAYFRRATTSYTRALALYRAGVRPELLQSGAWLLPSSRAGEAPHIVRLDGDWTCSCKAQSSMHWPIAMVVGCELANEDMERFDDGDVEIAEVAAIAPPPWIIGALFRRALSCDPPGENPLGDEPGDEPPDRRAAERTMGQRISRARAVHYAAFA